MEKYVDPSKITIKKIFFDRDRLKGLLYILTMTKGIDALLLFFNKPQTNKLVFILTIFSYSLLNSLIFDKHMSSSISLYFLFRFFVMSYFFYFENSILISQSKIYLKDWPRTKLGRKMLFSSMFIVVISFLNYNIFMNREFLSKRMVKQYENIGGINEDDYKFWDFIKQKIINRERELNQQAEQTALLF